MKYYLGPWQWVTIPGFGDCWDAPAGTKGRIDLRPLPCNVPGHGLFALESPPVEAGYIELADSLTKPLSSAAKAALIDALKLPSLDATNLRDALAEILTTKADPTGTDRSLPILPKLDGTLEIVLAGAVIWERPFTGEADPAWPNIQKVLQGNYRKIREQALVDGTQQHRKYLDALNAKYAISTEKFIPDDLPTETALPRATTITESFNKANNGLGPDLSWTSISGTWGVQDNEAQLQSATGGPDSARAESALSSDDHYAQADVTVLTPASGIWRGAACRFAAAAENYYTAFLNHDGKVYLFKVIGGGETNLGSTAVTPSLPDTVKVSAEGTTITSYFNGVQKDQVTDAIISGNLRGGIAGYSVASDGRLDNFEAADLEAAAVETTFNPNDANCTGWDGLDDTLPPSTLAMDTELGLSGAELNTISADDGNNITYEASSGYPAHHLRYALTGISPGDISQITSTAKGYGKHEAGPATYEYYMYIWDANASAWELMDSHTTGSKATLTDDVTTNITNYIHNIGGTDYVDILLVGPLWFVTGSAFVYTYYAELVIMSSSVVSAFVPWITIF